MNIDEDSANVEYSQEPVLAQIIHPFLGKLVCLAIVFGITVVAWRHHFALIASAVLSHSGQYNA